MATPRLAESGSRWFSDLRSFLLSIQKPALRLCESGSRHGESGSRYSNFLKFFIDFPNFKRLIQPFKRSIWQKRSQRCTVPSQNRNGSKGIVRDLWGTNFCKNTRKSASLPCPFKPTSSYIYHTLGQPYLKPTMLNWSLSSNKSKD